MTADSATIARGRKFDQVLAGAREVFMADGFEGASVDDIAQVAQVSKATLYKYFPDKRMLFVEVAHCECLRLSREAIEDLEVGAPPPEVLRRAGMHILEFVSSKFGQQLFRVCVAESDRFPEIGQKFYNSGPAVIRAEMVAYFEAAIARGELKIDDLELAADQFGELCKADLWPRLLFGVSKTCSPAEIERVVNGAVSTFMARYGA
ncbi:MAG: TetR/AcrR family transcriptional regulator [Sulfitobacter sp.]